MAAKKTAVKKAAVKKAGPKKAAGTRVLSAKNRRKLTDAEYQPLSEMFWDVATPLLARPGTEESTMMGTPCVRVNSELVGMVSKSFGGGLIVRLSKEDVDQHIANKVGDPFGPGDKIFKEWLYVRENDPDTWESLLEQSWQFASTLKKKKSAAKKTTAKKTTTKKSTVQKK